MKRPEDAARMDGPGDGIAAAAATWAARRREGLDADARERLLRWLAADRRHGPALERAEGTDDLDWPLYAGRVGAVVAGLERKARRRRTRRRMLAVAASGVIAAVIAWQTSVRWRGGDAAVSPVIVRQPTRATLPDGSVVETRDGASVTWDFADPRLRRIRLATGAAYFDVTADPRRPFVVEVGNVAVRAVGTAFAVERRNAEVSVVVTHGSVAIDAMAERTTLERTELAALVAGNGALIEPADATTAPGGVTTPAVRLTTEANLEESLGWRTPRLEFSGSPLREVVAVMNRHNRVQFSLGEPALAELQVSGALRADRVEALVAILETDWPIRAERRGETEIVLWGKAGRVSEASGR